MANQKTTQYATSVTTLANGDLIDVSKDTIGDGSVFDSQKISQTILRTTLGVNGTNKYIPLFNGTALTTSVMYQYDANRIGFFGVTTPTYSLGLDGTNDREIGMQRHTTANTAGNNFAVQSGGATSGATDKNGGNLNLLSGMSTGSGSSAINFYTATAGSAGTTDRTPTIKASITGAGAFNLEEGGTINIAGNKYLHYKHSTGTSVTGKNVFLGYNTALSATNGGDNTGIGYNALAALTSGGYNTCIGSTAGDAITDGTINTFVGHNAGGAVTTGTSNTAIGQGAWAAGSGDYNTCIGRWAAVGATTGGYNVIAGYNSASGLTSGSYNIGIGSPTFTGSTLTGSYNIAIGATGGARVGGTSSYNIIMGYDSGFKTGTGPFNYNIILGTGASTIEDNICIIGGSSTTRQINTIYLGTDNAKDTTASISQYTVLLRPGGTMYNSQNNMGGNNLRIGAGLSTGDGSAGTGHGNLILSTTNTGSSGATYNTYDDRITILGGSGNIGFWGTSFADGVKVMFVANATTVPTTNPTGGGLLYAEGGALKWRGSGGTVTTIAAA